MPSIHEAETFQAETREQWRGWLEANHGRDTGVRLVTFKKETGRPRMTYEESVEEALCFGWIDSRPGTVDTERSKLWFTRRKPGSAWSRVNKERIERMEAGGRMAPVGIAVVETARRDGSWERIDWVEALEVPDDLAAALAADPVAAGHWAAFPPSARKGILQWVLAAKRPETRAARVAETVRLAGQNVRANQWTPRT
jgi:uncharacterized protein YdeI (YjbR/CyaY-like superfamily)